MQDIYMVYKKNLVIDKKYIHVSNDIAEVITYVFFGNIKEPGPGRPVNRYSRNEPIFEFEDGHQDSPLLGKIYEINKDTMIAAINHVFT